MSGSPVCLRPSSSALLSRLSLQLFFYIFLHSFHFSSWSVGLPLASLVSDQIVHSWMTDLWDLLLLLLLLLGSHTSSRYRSCCSPTDWFRGFTKARSGLHQSLVSCAAFRVCCDRFINGLIGVAACAASLSLYLLNKLSFANIFPFTTNEKKREMKISSS